jgi:cellulose biosynthesis protein BcsQ
MAITICLVSRKGGVGKTSLTINLAGYCAREGLRVRVFDLDSQCSLSQFFLGSELVRDIPARQTVEAIFSGRFTADQVARRTSIEGIELVPCHLTFEAPRKASIELATEQADVQLLDTPPNLLDPVVRAALAASDFVLSPIVPEILGVQSIVSVQRVLHGVALATNPRLRLLGYLVNQRRRLAIHGAIEEMLRRLHGDSVFMTTVPEAAAFKMALTDRKPIHARFPKSPAAAAIAEVWEEVLLRIDEAAKPQKKAA